MRIKNEQYHKKACERYHGDIPIIDIAYKPHDRVRIVLQNCDCEKAAAKSKMSLHTFIS